MKKSIVLLAISVWIIASALTSCNTSAEKVQDAKNDVVEAKENLDEANKEYMADIENYKKEIADKIAANNQSIIEFKERIADQKADAKEAYQNKISDLEKKNSDMQMRMDDIKVEGKDQWEKFKREFSNDMDVLGKSFHDLTVRNVK